MMKNCDSLSEEKTVVDNSKCDNKCNKVTKVVRKENANARWKLLAKAILSNNKREMIAKEKFAISNLSNDFTGYDLVQVEQLKEDDTGTFTIKIDVGCTEFYCNVHIEKLWTMKDLIGFNNTGNIKFWASEAALTYFVMEEDNLQMFKDSWILELGCGMFGLAAMMLSKYSEAFAVHLSDGNQSSINNVRKSLNLNETKCFVKTSGKVNSQDCYG